ncbi:hypothetical protein Tco_1556421 [Tanacetum coccineum]
MFSSKLVNVVAYAFSPVMFLVLGIIWGNGPILVQGVAGHLRFLELLFRVSDSESDLASNSQHHASHVSVICHPVEERVGCCLEADASDSLGFFKLWSSALGGGLADPEAVESDLLHTL